MHGRTNRTAAKRVALKHPTPSATEKRARQVGTTNRKSISSVSAAKKPPAKPKATRAKPSSAPADDSQLASRVVLKAVTPSSLKGAGVVKKKRSSRRREPKKVRFAQGPLRAPAGGPDGHPTAEGRVAKPVRILDGGASRASSVTKKDVRELDQPELLGNTQYEFSLTKLKIRVGLLPPAQPARPFASNPKRARGSRHSHEEGGGSGEAAVAR
ncbi:hypothetical protein Agub_g4428 [Astrephomene gubernaculifera]|uniref:Uncharacterized protein n=1 Tax=Astrephomene gubernaculifera TaxID=47775 RepID=A0AAD3HJR3_9CHLO|nr:hypothetical protein Agub_g4428 [Astrephomene gubernaculifera]